MMGLSAHWSSKTNKQKINQKRKSHIKGMTFNLVCSEFIFICLIWQILALDKSYLQQKIFFSLISNHKQKEGKYFMDGENI